MMKQRIIKILLWMIWLPLHLHGIVVNEENLPDLAKKQLIISESNHAVTVAELYGIPLTVENFHPGQKFLDLIDEHIGIPVVEISRFSNERPLIGLKYTFDQVSTAYEASQRPNALVSVTGQPQTGKTVFLRTLEEDLNEHHPSDLIVFVKLSDVIKPENVNSFSLDDILRASIHEDFVELFNNVANINPSKVRLLFDGVDQVPHAQNRILSIVSELHQKSIRVIMTSCTDLTSKLILRNMNPAVIKIPSSLMGEKAEQFAFDYWKQKYALLSEPVMDSSIWQYSQVFQIIIQETPLPLTVNMLVKLVDYVSTDFIHESDILVVGKYAAENGQRIPRHIFASSDTSRFPKIQFYRTYLQNLEPMATSVYGPQALRMMFESKSIRIEQELNGPMETSKQLLATHGQDAFKFLIFNKEGYPVNFVHEEYKRYFAAEYILNSFSTANPLVETIKAVLHDPNNIFVMEFIESAIDNLADFRTLRMALVWEPADYKFAVLDNLIEHRFDKSCAKMFELLGPKLLKEYMQNSPLLQCKNKYSFGMLSDVRHFEAMQYLPRKTLWSELSGTRSEMIFHLGLKTAQLSARTLGWSVNPNTEMRYFAKLGISELDLFLERNPRIIFIIDEVNKAMYESISTLGEGSIPILEKLMLYGATPKDFAVNGRTLAHVAAEWLNRELLRYVHEELDVSLVDRPDDFGRTILATIIDAGWVMTRTNKGAWETMDYFIENGNVFAANVNFFSDELLQFHPKVDELPPAFRILVTGDDDDDPMSVVEAEYVIDNMVPLREVDLSLEKLATHRYLVGKYCVSILHEQPIHQHAQRKIQKIDDHVTITEFLAQLRRTNHLSETAEAAYSNTIVNILLKEINFFNMRQLRRVFTAIVKNTETLDDLDVLEELFEKRIAATFENELSVAQVRLIFRMRKYGEFPVLEPSDTVEYRIAVTIYDMEPTLYIDENNPNEEAASQQNINDFSVCDL